MGGSFIVFFGPEGAGKTTQINRLIHEMREHGIRVRVISLRDNHLLIPYVVKLLVKLGLWKFFEYEDRSKVKVANIDFVDKRLWALFQLFNLLPLYLLRYKIWHIFSDGLLVADRFIHDSITTLAHFLREPDILYSRIGRIYLGLLPKDKVSIFLYAVPHVLQERQKTRGTPIETEDFLNYQITVGKRIAKLTDALSIDTSNISSDDAYKLILQHLSKKTAVLASLPNLQLHQSLLSTC